MAGTLVDAGDAAESGGNKRVTLCWAYLLVGKTNTCVLGENSALKESVICLENELPGHVLFHV